jgi:hypothetical protein
MKILVLVFLFTLALVHRFKVSISILIPVVVTYFFHMYYNKDTPVKSEFDAFVKSVHQQGYQEYNPQQFQLLLEAEQGQVFNVFHDFVHTLPVSMLETHRHNIRRLQAIIPPQQLHNGYEEYTYRYAME